MNSVDTSQLKSLGLTSNRELATKTAGKGKLGQDQFLKLMVTQIQNQDPFKPMENGDFLAQLAQFGTVSGIQELQSSFAGLSNSLVSNQAMQACSLLGRNIVVQAGNFNHQTGKNLNASVDLTSSSAAVTVDIVDSSNQVVKTIQLGPQAKGQVNFAWDGKNNKGQLVPSGQYKMVAKANIGGKEYAMNTLLTEKVESVSIGNAQQGLLLNTSSKSTYSLTQIKKVQ